MESSQNFIQALEKQAFPLTPQGHWIGGRWVYDKKAELVSQCLNPSQNQLLMDIRVNKNQLEQALHEAEQSREKIRGLPKERRIEILQRLRQLLGDYRQPVLKVLKTESGKPEWEAQVELEQTLRELDHITANALQFEGSLATVVGAGFTKLNTDFEPLGIAAAYVPFSSSLATFMQTISGAVLAGCPLVLVASAHSSLMATLVGHMLGSLGDLTPGAVNVVLGGFKPFRQLITDRRVQAIIFTGSREHCETIRKEYKPHMGRQLLLQSGGKNSVIVHSSAQVDAAVSVVMMGATRSAGQLNSSTSRVFVHASLHDQYVEKLVKAVDRLAVGPTDTPGANPGMGPLYSQKAVDKFLRFQTMAKRDARDMLRWGRVVDSEAGGFFVSPGVHLMGEFDASSLYQSNVLLCPDVSIYRFDVLDEAIECANATDAPLVVSFVGDPDIILSRRQFITAPNLLINLPTTGIEAQLPVVGKWQAGDFRLGGWGLFFHLTYPQVVQQNGAWETAFPSWPKPHD